MAPHSVSKKIQMGLAHGSLEHSPLLQKEAGKFLGPTLSDTLNNIP